MADKWKSATAVVQKDIDSGKYRLNFGDNDLLDLDVERSGIYSTTDVEGQSVIEIPHGLDAIPSYWNVRGKNANAKNLGIADESADATNIVITPVFTNGDDSDLEYLWEAKL